MEFSVGGFIWRIAFAVVAVIAVVLSRRPTLAQRITEAIGFVALFGAAWVLVVGFEPPRLYRIRRGSGGRVRPPVRSREALNPPSFH